MSDGPVPVEVRTSAREELLDVTDDVREALARAGPVEGGVLVACPHTTAAVCVNEGADPAVAADIVEALRRLVPREADYGHAEGNADAHVKAVLVGPSVVLPVEDGDLHLGTWQRVFLCEFDGPRRRTLLVGPVGSAGDPG